MVFGHNLHLMAPFEILEAGFCTVFRRASFWFLVPGVKFGTRIQDWAIQEDWTPIRGPDLGESPWGIPQGESPWGFPKGIPQGESP